MSALNAALVEPATTSGRTGGLMTGQISALFAQLFHGQTPVAQMSGPVSGAVT
jgi:hypothetical protein